MVTREQIEAARLERDSQYAAYTAKPGANLMGVERRAFEAAKARHLGLVAQALAHVAECEKALATATAARCVVEDALMAAVMAGDVALIEEVASRHKDFNYQIERDAARALIEAWRVVGKGEK